MEEAAAPEKTSTTPFLQVALNSDGTLSRPPNPICPPSSSSQQPNDEAVFSSDIPLNPVHKTWLRIYRPPKKQHDQEQRKLPIVVFFHGGGFILFSAATAPYHFCCEQMARELPALVVSVDYRLAPESRLPAAYDDAVEAINWLKQQASSSSSSSDPSSDLVKMGDFSRCFLMGSSSGGNIAFHAGVRAAAMDDLGGVFKVAGHIYNQPYLGGVERMGSELALEDDGVLPLRAADMMWDLCLPEGADRDHAFCNPVKAAAAVEKGEGLAVVPPRCLVRANLGDPLIDRQREFAEMLRRQGSTVVGRLEKEGHHAVELFDPKAALDLIADVREFIYQ